MDRAIGLAGLTRRAALRMIGLGAAASGLFGVACGQTAPTTSSGPAAATVTAPAGAATTTTTAAGTTPGATSVAPAVGSTPGQTSGGTLTVTIPDLGAESMDVIIPQVNNVVPLIYEPLLRYDPQGNLMPWLAQSYSMSPDGKLWTFNLRNDVTWSNGDPFTSNDVKFSFQRFISDESQSPWSPLHRQTVDHIDTPDPYTVQVYAKDPPYVFYADAVEGTAIIPQNYFNQVGEDTFTKQPIGTGPWQLSSFSGGVGANLVPNQKYWGTKPVWDELALLETPEESTRIAMLKRGEADIVGISNDNAVTLRDSNGYQLRQTKASTIPGLFLAGYWLQPGPTSDQRVRYAMDLAINRQEVVDSFFKGFGQPAAGNISLTDLHWGFDPIWYSITYDPSQAQQLLQQAGYPGKLFESGRQYLLRHPGYSGLGARPLAGDLRLLAGGGYPDTVDRNGLHRVQECLACEGPEDHGRCGPVDGYWQRLGSQQYSRSAESHDVERSQRQRE